MLAGLGACAGVTPSAAPLSGGVTEPEPAAPAQQASAAAPATGKPAASPGKLGKRALYQRSCELGSAVGCNDLAILLVEEPERAFPLLERACSLGLTRGCANLAVQLLRSSPNEQPPRALDLLSQSCDRADEYACNELGDALYAGQQTLGKGALARAHQAYEKGCQLGSVDACANDGWMLRNGEGTAKNFSRARELFRFACDNKSYAGCAALGYDLIDGASNAKEQAEGARWLKVACDHDDAFGCFTLGAAWLSGQGGSFEAGLALLQRACALGSVNGCEYAALIAERMKSGGQAQASDEEMEAED